MVILHVVAPAEVGGLERVVQALAIGHHERGHEVAVAAVLEQNGLEHPFLAPLRRAGTGVYPILLPPRRYLRERSWIRSLCRRIGPDVLHTHGYRCDVVDAGSARSLGIAAVTTVHGFTGGGTKNRLYEWLQQRAFRQFDAVVAVSQAQVEVLARARVPRQRIHVLPNAWSGTSGVLPREAARRELGVPNERFHIGWVGRLSQEKGLDVLIEACAHLADLPLMISVLGDGREHPRLVAQVRALGLDGRVQWLGTVSDAGRLFRAFDVFVLSSRTEGTPIVLFEAMAVGTPIVATAVGGVPDVVSSAEALLVPPDDPPSLTDAIRAVRDAPEAASGRAAAAQCRLAVEFRVEPWLKRYEVLYQEIQRPTAGAVRS